MLTSPSFCTSGSERVYITDRTGFFVPTLGRVFGSFGVCQVAGFLKRNGGRWQEIGTYRSQKGVAQTRLGVWGLWEPSAEEPNLISALAQAQEKEGSRERVPRHHPGSVAAFLSERLTLPGLGHGRVGSSGPPTYVSLRSRLSPLVARCRANHLSYFTRGIGWAAAC